MKDAVKVYYVNWKGVGAIRNIIPKRLFFGSTEYHPEEQWLLEVFDCDKLECRTFAMKDIRVWM